MEKYIKMEQDLNEERLQEITGGCRLCVPDKAKIAFHQGQAQNLWQLSKTAQQYGWTDASAQLGTLSQNAQGAAKVYDDKIIARHGGASRKPKS
jgi:hypothetical protein